MIIYLRLIFTSLLAILACKYCIGYFHNVQVYSKNYFNKNYVKVVSIFDLIGDHSRKQWYKISKQDNNNFALNRNKKKISEDIHSSSNTNSNNDRKRNIISSNQDNDEYLSNYTTPLQPFEEIQPDKNSKKPLLLARFLSWMLKRIVITKTEDIRGLDMNVLATSNRNVMRGQFDTIEMKFDKIAYQNFFVSGGGKLIIKDLNLTMRKLLFQNNIQSIRKPFKIYCDLLLTQQDIVQSQFIKQLIQLLVDTVLEKVFGSNKVMNIAVKSVSIKEHKIHASGVARILADVPSTKQLHSLAQLMNYPPPSTISYNHSRVSRTTTSSSSSSNRSSVKRSHGMGSSTSSADKLTTSEQAELISMDFEVCSGMGIKHNGQTVYLKDILVTLNPDTLLSTVMPITTTSPIEVDIGENSQIQSLVIAKKNIWVRAASLVSTVQPFTVATVRRRSTSFHYDLSALLTSVLTLRGGLVTHQLSWLTVWFNNKRQLVLRNNNIS